jgi:hypothetical protein
MLISVKETPSIFNINLNLQQYLSHPNLLLNYFPSPYTHKQENRIIKGQHLLVANNLNYSIYLVNQKQVLHHVMVSTNFNISNKNIEPKPFY